MIKQSTRKLLMLFATVVCLVSYAQSKTEGYDNLATNCKEKTFPIVSGGSKDEKVSCVMHIPQYDMMLVVGNTTSDDYAPAANDHAYVYAIDK